MTREEAIEFISRSVKSDVDMAKVADAIKVLERTNVLAMIRAEIVLNAYPIVHGVNNHEKGMTLYGILQVIDKYKAESEVNTDES